MLIGLYGYAGSGKDTAYQYIAEYAGQRGRSAHRSAFADRLKISAVKALGFLGTDDQCLDLANQMKQSGWEVIVREPNGDEHAISTRQYWQYFGDEAHRQMFGEHFWIEPVMHDYGRLYWDYFVVADVRYENEARAIRHNGGEVWHIDRPECAQGDPHLSEQPLSPHLINRTIPNHRTPRKLRKHIRQTLKQLPPPSHGRDHS